MKVLIYIETNYADNEICFIGRNIREKYEVKTVSKTNDMVISRSCLKVLPDYGIDDVINDISDYTMLILCGGSFWRQNKFQNEKLKELIDLFIKNNKKISAICDASTFLIYNNYLNNIYHTGNGLEYIKDVCPNYKDEKYYVKKECVNNRNFITANGRANLEFAREIFKELKIDSDENIEKWYNYNRYDLYENER